MGVSDFLFVVPVLVFSVVVHEVAHAWQALREGDSTARDLGRITLNPLPHLDLVGSLLVPVVLFLLPGNLIFGWAKPVPVNPANFRDYRAGDLRVSLAGIIANLALAATFSAAYLIAFRLVGVPGVFNFAAEHILVFLSYGILINLILAWFNLMPLPPLDGSRVLHQLLPPALQGPYQTFGKFGSMGFLLALVLVPGALSKVFAPVWIVFAWIMGIAIG